MPAPQSVAGRAGTYSVSALGRLSEVSGSLSPWSIVETAATWGRGAAMPPYTRCLCAHSSIVAGEERSEADGLLQAVLSWRQSALG